MKRLVSLVTLAVPLLALALGEGCGANTAELQSPDTQAPSGPSTEGSETRWSAELKKELVPRASFDLDCPKEKLTASCLDDECYQAGVRGCGHRATYVFNRTQRMWIMNSQGSREPAAASSAVASASASAAPVQPEPGPTSHVSGAAGFELGAASDASKAACERAGNQWNAIADDRATCSGPAADMGSAAQVELTLAKGRTVGITVFITPDSGWMARVISLREDLAKKHGAPRRTNVTLPKGCEQETEFLKCLNSATASLEYIWRWATGSKIVLTAGRRKGANSDAVITLKVLKQAN